MKTSIKNKMSDCVIMICSILLLFSFLFVFTVEVHGGAQKKRIKTREIMKLFSFDEVTDAIANEEIISNTIIISGIIEAIKLEAVSEDAQTTIILNGEDSNKNDVSVVAGDTVALKAEVPQFGKQHQIQIILVSSEFNTVYTTWNITTTKMKKLPKFTHVKSARLNVFYRSNSILINGLPQKVDAVVRGGSETSIILNGIDQRKSSVLIGNGDLLAIKTRSAVTLSETVETTLQVGALTSKWQLITEAPKSIPEVNGEIAGCTSGDFNVSNNGSANYHIPISIPKGTAGMEPSLSLDYNSHGPNGILGVGWTVSGLPSITRYPATMVHDGFKGTVNLDGNDRFCLDGQRLIAVKGKYGHSGTEYRTENDTFSKIVSHGKAGSGPHRFNVWTKSGLIMELGFTDDSRCCAHEKNSVLIWAVNKIEDTKGNYITISYYKDHGISICVPHKVEYTGHLHTLEPYNQILFEYENKNRPDAVPRYIAGSLQRLDRRLTGIKVFDTETLVRSYQFTYEDAGSIKLSQLTSITEYGSDGKPFRPTTFTWSDKLQGTQFNNKIPLNTYGSFYNKNNDVEIHLYDFNGDGRTDILRTIKNSPESRLFLFRKGTFHDAGQVTVPEGYLDYKYLKDDSIGEPSLKTTYRAKLFFADFNGDGKVDILRTGNKKFGNANYLLLYKSEGDGFETARPLNVPGKELIDTNDEVEVKLGDFNGDGKMDLLRTWLNRNNNNILLSNGEGFNDAGLVSILPDNTFLVHSTVEQSSLDQPEKKIKPIKLYLADFNGDGKTDILRTNFMALSKNWLLLSNGNGFEQAIEIKVTPNNLHSRDNGIRIHTADFNGDGKVDILRVSNVPHQNELFLSTGNAFVKTGNISVPGGILETPEGNFKVHLSDFNGDGLLDILRSENGSGSNVLLLFDGATFHTIDDIGAPGGILRENNRCKFHLLDANRDGKTDILRLCNGDNRLLLSMGDRFIDTGTVLKDEVISSMHITDFNGDGKMDILRTHTDVNYNTVFQSVGATLPHQLIGITDGHGLETTIQYRPLTHPEVYGKGNKTQFPVIDFIGPYYVVHYFEQSNGTGSKSRFEYYYKNAELHLQGRGFLGFRYINQKDYQQDIYTETEYSTNYLHKGNNVLRSLRRLGNGTGGSAGTVIVEEKNSIETVTTSPGVTFCFYKKTVIKKFEKDGSPYSSQTVQRNYDNYGNLTRQFTFYGAAQDQSCVTEESLNVYLNQTENWQLGRLTEAAVVKTSGIDAQRQTQRRETHFSYHKQSGLLIKETIEPNNPEYTYEKLYIRDQYGNIKETQTIGPGIPRRSYKTFYDHVGRFIVSKQNAVGHIETMTYNNHGLLSSQTSPNKLTTRFSYDGFGRVSRVIHPNGMETRTSYIYCNGHVDGLKTAVFIVRTDITGVPPTIKYYDNLNRQVRLVRKGFDGQSIYVDTKYTTTGKISKVSSPYFCDRMPPVWHANLYDSLGRIFKEVTHDGRIYLSHYKGLTVSVTNPRGMVEQRVYDQSGRLVKAIDAENNETIYRYDGFANLTHITDPLGNVTVVQYDLNGNKVEITDPDTGVTTYTYNALGELLTQTDALGQKVSLKYDSIGRMISREEPEGTSSWVYDKQTNGIGLLSEMSGPDGFKEVYHYDELGRRVETVSTISGRKFVLSNTYDYYGRIDTVTYPTTFSITRTYNDMGYLSHISDDNGKVFWRMGRMNARGQVELQILGNGLSTEKIFDSINGRTESIVTQNVQVLRFEYDKMGNLKERLDGSFREAFTYDNLNRLTSAAVDGGHQISVQYDALGNILSKSDVGNYTYGANNAGPHALTSTTGTVNNKYSYDTRGNVTRYNDTEITYTSYNKHRLIRKGELSARFKYKPNYVRYLETRWWKTGGSRKVYAGDGLFEQEYKNNQLENRHYIFAGDELIALRSTGPNRTTKTYYLHKDHLRSIDAITDETGQLVEKLSYDAWGKRRNVNWSTPSTPIKSSIDRGFTGHEHLDYLGLINMNARLYDPVTARFLSPDTFVQEPLNLQNLNRYSYVLNNPLSIVDPSGYFFDKIFHAVVSQPLQAFGNFVEDHKVTIVAVGVGLATAGIGSAVVAGLGIAATGTASAVLSGALFGFGSSFAGTVASGGGIDAGLQAGIRGGIIGGVSAGLSYGIGQTFQHGPAAQSMGAWGSGARIAAHGVVGGAGHAANGGNFEHGFFSGALSAAVSPYVEKINGFQGAKTARVAAAAVIGGTISEIGGGKFSNGAVTGAFVRLYNCGGEDQNIQAQKRATCLQLLGKGKDIVDIRLCPVMNVGTPYLGVGLEENGLMPSFGVPISTVVPAFASVSGNGEVCLSINFKVIGAAVCTNFVDPSFSAKVYLNGGAGFLSGGGQMVITPGPGVYYYSGEFKREIYDWYEVPYH